MFNKNLLKSSFLITITLMEKVEDEEGNSTLKVIDTINEKMSRNNFIYDINEDERNGIKHEFEVVQEKPINFQINKIYILADGSRMWVYLKKDSPNSNNEVQENSQIIENS